MTGGRERGSGGNLVGRYGEGIDQLSVDAENGRQNCVVSARICLGSRDGEAIVRARARRKTCVEGHLTIR